MAFELDHLFICTDIGAPEADRLVAMGLVEGSSNTHPGQGTTNRRFFFHNAMLELLWVHNPAEAQSELIRPTHLWERWVHRNDGASPFGVCLRPSSGAGNSVAFASWAYHPPYLPKTMSIEVAQNSDRLTEPMLFQISFGQRPDRFPAEKSQPLDHQLGLREITRVALVCPDPSKLSAELQTVVDTLQIQLKAGADYRMELGFDGEGQGHHNRDLRPGLPLVMSW